MLDQAGLIYVSDAAPGISRRKAGKGFAYYSPTGELIKDPATLKRIRSLAIPPAYTNVWICPLEDGHIQATGRDAKGRKQYRYHAKWIDLTNENKFARMLAFGSALPRIRERVEEDLGSRGLTKEKVLATVVWFLENSLIRVGNEEYAKENKSYGLTTMKMRHCKVEGSVVQFKFKGKRGIKHDIALADRRMARVVKKLQELPGQDLFRYIGDDGAVHTVTSADVNAYLKEITGEDFTAKDFRTWAATVMALAQLSGCCGYGSAREAKRSLAEAMRQVSAQLGNTPAICRKSYVHPRIVDGFLDGSLRQFLESRISTSGAGENPIDECAEAVALELLAEMDLPKAA